MNITYTWKIKNLKVRDENGKPNAVVQTYWEKIGTDEQGNTGVFSGATPFTAENVAPEAFIPFEQLTEEIVLGWIQNVVVGSYEEHVNDQILKQITEKRNPISDVPLPWAPAPAPSSEPAPISNP